MDRLYSQLQDEDDAARITWQRRWSLKSLGKLLFFTTYPYVYSLWNVSWWCHGCHVMSHNVMWCRTMSCDVTQCHMMSHVIWCHMSCDVMWCHTMSCDVTQCHVMSHNAMWCHNVMWCRTMSWCHMIWCSMIYCVVVTSHDVELHFMTQLILIYDITHSDRFTWHNWVLVLFSMVRTTWFVWCTTWLVWGNPFAPPGLNSNYDIHGVTRLISNWPKPYRALTRTT